MLAELSYQKQVLIAAIAIGLALVVWHLVEKSVDGTKESSQNAVRFIEKSRQWLAMSEQDKQAAAAFQHVNYAVAFLDASRESASDAVLERGTQIDVHQYSRLLHGRQHALARKLQTAGQIARSVPQHRRAAT
jgi:hypothetical protein